MGTKPMSQSLVKNLIHLVYSTKNRRPWIAKNYRNALFAYQAGIFREWDSPAITIGGVEDHVHVLFALSKESSTEEDCRGSEEGELEVDEDRRPKES